MVVAVAGAHGQVARRLVRLLSARGEEVVGLVRSEAHLRDVAADGGRGALVDLERASAGEVARAVTGADAVVFAAGAGPGSGDARKESVDRAGAVLLADGAARAGVRAYALVSSTGLDAVRDQPSGAPGAAPEGVEAGFAAYLRAKLAAEDALRARAAAGALDLLVLRPGRLTDDPGTGRVRLAPAPPPLPRGDVTRDDVAAVLAALLRAPARWPAEAVLELVGGQDPVEAAADAALAAAATAGALTPAGP